MAELIPEKRMDRNGRLVTKHVRSGTTTPPQRPALPAPGLSTIPKKEKPFKLRPRQLEKHTLSLRLSNYKSSDPLTTEFERNENFFNSAYCNFTASDVEFYDVLSVTGSVGNTIELMRAGIRSADTARAHLHGLGAEHLVNDRSEMTQEALRRGIGVYDFAGAYESLSLSERESPHVVDAVEFMGTALNKGSNALVKDEILHGTLSYSDIKAIGITKLQSYSRANALVEPLITLHAGEANYTIDDVKELVALGIAEKADDKAFSAAASLLHRRGIEAVRAIISFEMLSRENYSYYRSIGHVKKYAGKDPEYVYDLCVYSAQIRGRLKTNLYGKNHDFTDEFYDAGIPLDTAVEVINAGGGVREATAIHAAGIESSLAGGWL